MHSRIKKTFFRASFSRRRVHDRAYVNRLDVELKIVLEVMLVRCRLVLNVY